MINPARSLCKTATSPQEVVFGKGAVSGKVLGIDLTVDPYLVEDDTDLYGSDRGAEVVGAAPVEEFYDGDEAPTNADE